MISDIEPIIDYCVFEKIPKEQSAVYQSLKADYGEIFADQFTYERGMNGSDELLEVIFIITGGTAPAIFSLKEAAHEKQSKQVGHA